MQLYTQTFVSGVLSAGVLTLIAIGFSLQWRSLKIVNLAHFSIVLLAAYVTYEFSSSTGADPFLALVIVIPVFAAVAAGLQWVYDHFKVTLFNSLLVSFAIFVFVEGLITKVWGRDFLSIKAKVNPYSVKSFEVFNIAIPVAPLIAFAVAVPITIAAALFLRKSNFGKGLRAVAQDREIAVAYGVNYHWVSTLLAAASGATAAIGGTLLAVSGSIFPSAAEAWIGLVFAVVILGGIGSPVGALVSAMLVGGITGVGSTKWGVSAAQLITFLIVMLMLLWRPDGLFKRLHA